MVRSPYRCLLEGFTGSRGKNASKTRLLVWYCLLCHVAALESPPEACFSHLSPFPSWPSSPGVHSDSVWGEEWHWLGCLLLLDGRSGVAGPALLSSLGCYCVALPVLRSQTSSPSSCQLFKFTFSVLLLYPAWGVGTNRSRLSCLDQKPKVSFISRENTLVKVLMGESKKDSTIGRRGWKLWSPFALDVMGSWESSLENMSIQL